MSTRSLIYIFVIFIFCLSCTKKIEEKSVIKETNLELQMIEAYQEGLRELKKGDALFAAKKFNEAEILFPQSDVAPRAALMAAYSYYSQSYYGDAISELKRFLRVYPKNNELSYAEYLLGLCYYEQIVDEKKDLQSIENSKKIFSELIIKYPNTEFAIDAEFKLNLINDILAAKEMYVGRYYFERKKWIAAINRFKYVIDDYETTIYVEEALYRLVEIHYLLGLQNESQKYAKLLGYNYQSSDWYERSYKILNKDYKKTEIKKNLKEQKSLLKKFKDLFQ